MLKYSIYFPSKDKNGIPIPKDERAVLLAYVLNKCVSQFGGCTIVPVQGVYKHRHGMIVHENVDRIDCITGDSDSQYIVQDIAVFIKDAMYQESVLAETSTVLADFI